MPTAGPRWPATRPSNIPFSEEGRFQLNLFASRPDIVVCLNMAFDDNLSQKLTRFPPSSRSRIQKLISIDTCTNGSIATLSQRTTHRI